jgi:hypothetical protein
MALATINFIKKELLTRWFSYICFKLSGRSKAEVTAPRAAIARSALGYILRCLENVKKKEKKKKKKNRANRWIIDRCR